MHNDDRRSRRALAVARRAGNRSISVLGYGVQCVFVRMSHMYILCVSAVHICRCTCVYIYTYIYIYIYIYVHMYVCAT